MVNNHTPTSDTKGKRKKDGTILGEKQLAECQSFTRGKLNNTKLNNPKHATTLTKAPEPLWELAEERPNRISTIPPFYTLIAEHPDLFLQILISSNPIMQHTCAGTKHLLFTTLKNLILTQTRGIQSSVCKWFTLNCSVFGWIAIATKTLTHFENGFPGKKEETGQDYQKEREEHKGGVRGACIVYEYLRPSQTSTYRMLPGNETLYCEWIV